MWRLGTRGLDTMDLGTSSMGRGDVWDRDSGRQIQGHRMLMIIAINAISVTLLVNMFW